MVIILTPMSSKLSISRSILPFGFKSLYQLHLHLKPGELSRLCHALIQELWAPVFAQSHVLNLKGRDPGNIIAPQLAQVTPTSEELFWVAGRIPCASENLESSDPHHNISLSIQTAFESFPNTHSVSHSINHRRIGLPDWLGSDLIGWTAPILLSDLRLGIDIFKSRYMTSFFGFVPTVTQTVLIEASDSELFLQIECEALNRRDQLPLQQGDIFKSLNSAFVWGSKFNIIEDYQSKVSC